MKLSGNLKELTTTITTTTTTTPRWRKICLLTRHTAKHLGFAQDTCSHLGGFISGSTSLRQYTIGPERISASTPQVVQHIHLSFHSQLVQTCLNTTAIWFHTYSHFSTLHGSLYIVCATSWQFYYIPLLLAIITHNTEVANYLVFHLASEPIAFWGNSPECPNIFCHLFCWCHVIHMVHNFPGGKKQYQYGGYKNEVIFNHNHQSTPWNFSKTYIPFIIEQCALIIMKLQDRNVQSPNPQEL